MRGALRAEMLRALSGSALLAVLAFAILVPLLLVVAGPGEGLAGRPTPTVYAASSGSFVTALFLGSYGVTREYYYGSIDRSLVLTRLRHLVGAKAAAAALVSAAMALLVAGGWLGVTAVLVASTGDPFEPTTGMLMIAVGSVLSSAIGGALGSAVGWVTRNYYVACALVLGLPFAVELPLLSAAPEVERFLPSGALAALAAPGGLGLLEPPLALAVALAWLVAASAPAWLLARRRHG